MSTNTSKKPKALSLFSGAMGLDLGLEKAGIEVVACVEQNHLACETIRHNRKNISVFEGDISELDPLSVLSKIKESGSDIDLIVGGPPCQAFSVFGKRKGLNDIRGRLVYDFVRFVKAIKPKAFLMENVRGLMSMKTNKDSTPGSLLTELFKEFKSAGYRVDAFVVNSVNYGAPQIRERLILIGNRIGKKASFPLPTHSDNPINGQKNFKNLGDVIRNFRDPDTDLMDFSARKKKFLSLVPEGGNWRSLPLPIQMESMGKSFFLKGGRSAYWRRLSWDSPSPTVVTMPNHASTSMCHPEETRALTVGECAAIQGFPTKWKFLGNPVDKYKQIGNAVPIVLGEVAGKALIELLNSRQLGHKIEHSITHIRPHVRTRQYFKNGEACINEPYRKAV